MSTAEPTTRRLTAKYILLGDVEDDNSLARSFQEHGVLRSGIKGLRHLSGPAMRAVTNQLADVLLNSLDLLNVKDMLAGGWCKYKDLTDAAKRTRTVAGSEELVALAAHRIDSTHQPSVDLIVKDATVYTCVFDLNLAFDLNGVLALVRQGELAALRGGTCLVTGTLALGEIPLLPPQERRIDLAKSLPLNPAIRLLKEAVRRADSENGVTEVRPIS